MNKIFITVTLLILCLSGAASWWVVTDMQSQLQHPLRLDTPHTYTVRHGASLTSVSGDLVDRGWLPHPYYLIIVGRQRGVASSIKTGEYRVQPGMTPLDFLDMIVSGRVIQYSLTIPEGWTFRQIVTAVAGSRDLVQTLVEPNAGNILAKIGRPPGHGEGMFFPDTYRFPSATTDVQFLQRAYDTMAAILDEEWQHRASGLPLKTSYEALILASLIERETASPGERAAISGVFIRRLQGNMKLQTDPTVIYAMGESFDGDIRTRDLDIDSPYNTYRYGGLPPTPIAAPGLASIRAAMHPEDGNALYFVATGDGRHQFSTTLEEHNRAVARYQLRGR